MSVSVFQENSFHKNRHWVTSLRGPGRCPRLHQRPWDQSLPESPFPEKALGSSVGPRARVLGESLLAQKLRGQDWGLLGAHGLFSPSAFDFLPEVETAFHTSAGFKQAFTHRRASSCRLSLSKLSLNFLQLLRQLPLIHLLSISQNCYQFIVSIFFALMSL